MEPKWDEKCSKLSMQVKTLEKQAAVTALQLSEAEGRCIALSQESREWVGQINLMDTNHANDLERAMAELASTKQAVAEKDKQVQQLQKQVKELQRTVRNISTETGDEISEATVSLNM